MNNKCFFVAGVLFCVAACGQSTAGDQPFSFKPDSTKVYSIIITKGNGREQREMSLEVIRSMDSMYLLKLIFDNFKIVSNLINADTRSTPPSAAELKNDQMRIWDYLLHYAKGMSVNIWMNNHGLVRDVVGIDNVIDSIVKVSGEDRRTVRYLMKEYINATLIKDELDQLFSFVPARPKEKGQSWVIDLMLLTNAPVQLSNIYVLEKRSGDSVSLSISSVVSARQGDQGRVYMKGKMTGNIVASYRTGIPYSYYTRRETTTTTDKNVYTDTSVTTATVQLYTKPGRR